MQERKPELRQCQFFVQGYYSWLESKLKMMRRTQLAMMFAIWKFKKDVEEYFKKWRKLNSVILGYNS